ncbi:hypothetical protein, partial [Pseudomonas sp. FW306-02-H05-AB]|uniref:hypothetical protein n=1 Tax=Pseudomonas sp. FW306-02-H05-AB TaxID=2070666 RepID=UPI002115B8FA
RRYAADFSALRGKDQAGALTRAFPQCKDGPGATFVRQIDLEIKALAHRQPEPAARKGLNGMSIHRDKTCLRLPGLNPEHRGSSAVD